MAVIARILLTAALAISFAACGTRVEEEPPVPDAGTEQPDPVEPKVTVSPANAATIPGKTVQFLATVTGLENKGVIWSLSEGVEAGTISESGLYTPSEALGAFRVVATSVADSAVRGEAIVTVSVPDVIDPCERTSADELLADGDFSKGLECWAAHRHKAEGGFTVDETDHPADTSAPSIRAENDQVGNDLWDTQLYQDGLHITSGQEYLLTYWGKAAEPRDIVVLVQQVDPGPTVHFHYETVAVTTEWQKFERSFTAATTVENGMVEFQFGESSTAAVWVDGVSLKRTP